MTDFRRAEEVWDEEDSGDDAKTLVARNPLLRRVAQPEGATESAAAGFEDLPASVAPAGDTEHTVDAEHALLGDGAEFGSPDGVTADPGDELVRESAELLRDSEVDRLQVDAADACAVAPLNESGGSESVPDRLPSTPSIVVERGFTSRNEITERISTIPRTHLLASSIAPTAAPKTVPPQSAPRGNSWLSMGLAAAALVGLGIALGRMSDPEPVQRSSESAPRTAAVSAPSAKPALEEPVQPAPVAPEPVAALPVEPSLPSAVEPVALVVEAPPAAEAQPEPRAETVAVTKALEPVGVAATAVPRQRAPRAERKAKSSGEASAEPTVSRVTRTREPLPTAKAGLPEQPAREQVVEVINGLADQLAACTAGRRGIVELALTIRGSGQVSYALVRGSFAGTPEGTCISKAVREAQFPAFSQPFLKLTYPIQL